MRIIRRRPDGIERELRSRRPEPRVALLESLERRIVGERAPRSARPLRVGLAVALSVGLLSALAATGGLSYAATGVDRAVTAATHIVVPEHQAVSVQSLSSARGQYLVAMCFYGHTIYVDSRAVRILLALGATLGPCQERRHRHHHEPPPPPPHRR